MAAEADLVLVVGSRNSSNSQRLAELARSRGVPAYLIDGPADIDVQWLRPEMTVAITAGASAPETVVKQCVFFLQQRFSATVETRQMREEQVRFALPKPLGKLKTRAPGSKFFRADVSAVTRMLHFHDHRDFAESLVEGQQILGGGVGLDVVDGVEDESAAATEDLDPLADFLADRLGRAEGERLLRVHAATPERQPGAEFLFQHCRIHPRGGALHGVKDVEPGFDQVRQKSDHRSAGMDESLPRGVLVDPVVDAAVVGLKRSR